MDLLYDRSHVVIYNLIFNLTINKSLMKWPTYNPNSSILCYLYFYSIIVVYYISTIVVYYISYNKIKTMRLDSISHSCTHEYQYTGSYQCCRKGKVSQCLLFRCQSQCTGAIIFIIKTNVSNLLECERTRQT